MAEAMNDSIDRAAALVRGARHVCVLTGAGVSAESGVPTFRDKDGLWEGERPEDVATPEAFHANPAKVWRFYNERRARLVDIQPNAGHGALAAIEQRVGRFDLITQNIDGLHVAAGSTRVVEVHGNIWEVRCVTCPYERRAVAERLPDEPRCPECGDWLRPNVVWFGEMLPADGLASAERALMACDVMLVVGTSGVVQPVASMAVWARDAGASVIEVNPQATPISPIAEVRLVGPGGELLPAVVASAWG